jgi:DNA-binding LacI/PurR family transcriptional regulator
MRRSTTSRVSMPATPRHGSAQLQIVNRASSSKKPATQTDVAKLAGVSQAAVSRWTSGRGYVAPAAREQIVKAVAALDYRPHPLAQGLSSGQSDMVAVVIAHISNPGYQIMLEKITQTLQAMNLQVLLFIAAPTQSVDDVLPDVLRYRVRGTIITTSQLSSMATRQLVARGIPVVLLHRYTRIGGAHCVVCDNVDGGRMAAEVLCKAGARQVAFIGGNADSSSNADRRTGFLQELQRRGLAAVAALDGEFTYEWGLKAALELCARHPQIGGLFCADDEIATGAMDALRFHLGKGIPADVKVIGFDDHPIGAKAAYELTTIRQPFDEMISKAIDILLAGNLDTPSTKLFRGEIVARGSV